MYCSRMKMLRHYKGSCTFSMWKCLVYVLAWMKCWNQCVLLRHSNNDYLFIQAFYFIPANQMFNICFKLITPFVYVKINDIFKSFSCLNFREKTSYETPELHILVCKISVPKYYVEEFKFHSFIEAGLFGAMVWRVESYFFQPIYTHLEGVFKTQNYVRENLLHIHL